MGKKRIQPNYRRRTLRLPDLDHSKLAVLNSLGSPASRRVYEFALDRFITWYCSEPRLAFNRIVVTRYRMHLESLGLAANTINQRLAAVRRLAHEAADAGLLSPELAAGISRVRGVKQLGFRVGNWLSADECSAVLKYAFGPSMRAKRDYAMLAMLFGCGLRRSELVGLDVADVQVRQGHWAVVDLIGKGGHIRTVPIPDWAKAALDDWTAAAGITAGRIFRAVARGKVWGDGISQNVVWYVVKGCCERAGLQHIAPHDLRRTCAKLCHDSGGELEQIQFLLGHVSVQTTERYLGCKQNLGHPVNDLFRLRNVAVAVQPDPLPSPPDAPMPDLGSVPGPPDKSKSKLKRALVRAKPNCVDAVLHTCWSSPPGDGKTMEEREFAKNMEIGTYYFKNKNYRGAEMRFRHALEYQPGQAEATFRLAESLDKLAKYDEAKENYEAYVSIQPDGPYIERARMALQRLSNLPAGKN